MLPDNANEQRASGPSEHFGGRPTAPHRWRRLPPAHHELPRSLRRAPPLPPQGIHIQRPAPRVRACARRCCAQRPICKWCCQQRHCSTCAGEPRARGGLGIWQHQPRRFPFRILGAGGAEARHRRRCEPRWWRRPPLLQGLGHRAPAEWTPIPCWASQPLTCPNATHALAWERT